jgi:hypothetical protein
MSALKVSTGAWVVVCDGRKALILENIGDRTSRIVPVRRSTSFPLPAIESRADKLPARTAILEAVANGLLTPSEATNMFDLIDKVVRALPAPADCIEAR